MSEPIAARNAAPKHCQDGLPSVEESLEARIARLGRERPPAFRSALSEVAFVGCITVSQFLTEYFVSGFTVLLPVVTKELDIPQAASIWPATAFSLVIASTLLVFGRLGDIWGGRPVFLGGLAWLLIWSIVAGFSVSTLMLNFSRALQGLGAAAFLPSGVMLMGTVYRPGPRKNLVFAIYGTAAVFGFFGGIFAAGMVGQFVRWGWYFWIGGVVAGITLLISVFVVRLPTAKSTSGVAVSMDYPGAFTIVSGLILTVFAITQSAHAPSGWRTPYILVCFILGVLLLSAAAYIETSIARDPLLPASIFTTSAMTPLLLALFLLYGTWGIFSGYGTMYFQNIMSVGPLQIVAWYAPIGVAGLLFSVLEGFILHLVPGQILLVISGLAALGSQLLLALMPETGAYYWAWVFPTAIMSTVGIDLSTILMTVFITTAFPLAEQGLAGGVINSVLQLGVAFVLGLTDILQAGTVYEGGLARSYKNTFWFGVGAGAVALLLLAVWGKVPKATSELTPEEMEELLREVNSGSSEASPDHCRRGLRVVEPFTEQV